MGEDGRNFRDVLANLCLEDGHTVVGLFQAQAFVELEVLFHMQVSLEILHANVVHVEVVARGHGTDTIENVFRTQGARHGVDHDVGVGQHVMHCVGYGFSHLLGALESNVAADADGQVGKVAVAGATNAHPVHFEQTVYRRDCGDNLVAHSLRSGVEQGVDRLAGQTPAYVDDDPGHE